MRVFLLLKYLILFVWVLALCRQTLYAQPGALGANNLNGSPFTCTALNDKGSFRQVRIQATQSSSSVTWEFPNNCTYSSPADIWRPYFTNSPAISFNTYQIPGTPFNNGALYNNSNQGASGLLAATTNGYYYTFNVTENPAGSAPASDNFMEVLETNFNPVTINTVTQSPNGSNMLTSQSPTITITTSSAPSSGEYVYLRYATNINFTSSTLVTFSFAGATGTAQIPVQTGGTTIYYYILSSNKTSAQIISDVGTYGQTAYDMSTLNLKALVESGSGNTNYSYTVTSNPVMVVSAGGSGSPSTTYTSLANAITAINGGTAHTGTTTCYVNNGWTETTPTGGFSITAIGTSLAPIIFIKSGTGANPIFTAATGLTAGSLTNAIFKLIGADYITLDGFTMQENSSNTTTAAGTNNMTEWGVAFLYASTTNGAQNNTIQNCTISLNRTYTNTFGIYSNTNHSATVVGTTADITSASGSNSYNKVYSNNISNVNSGIAFIGCGATGGTLLQDMGNDIGGSSASTSNTLSNWGNSGAASSFIRNSGTVYGILMNHQQSSNVSYNILTSATVSSASATRGIFQTYSNLAPLSGNFTNTISYNTVTVSTSTTPTFEIIRNDGMTTSLSSVTINITNNKILNCSTSGSFTGIFNSSIPGTVNINNDTIQGTNSSGATAAFTGIQTGAAIPTAININNNQIGTSSGNAITFSNATSGTVLGISNTSGLATTAVSIINNNFQGFVHSVAGSSTHTYIQNTVITASQNISTNTFTNLNVNTTGNITFIANTVNVSSGTKTASSNSIVTGFNKGSAGGTVTFYSGGSGSSSGTTHTTNNNNFSNITVTGATNILGWSITETNSTKIIQDNYFQNISGPGGTSCDIISLTSGASATVSGNYITNISGAVSSTGIRGIVTAAGTQTYSGNFINTISNTNGNVQGISIGAGGTSMTVSQNIIHTLSSSAASSTVSGIAFTSGNLLTVTKNKIYGLSQSNATVNTTNGAVNGIQIGVLAAGNVVNIYNNLIGILTAPNANSSTIEAIRGINIGATATSTITLYYNTIYMNANGGAEFSTSGIYHTSNGTSTLGKLVMKNNIIINKSTPNGSSGRTVALRRSSSLLNNYFSISPSICNNNLFYAGTASSTNLLYYDGTNSDQTISAFQTRVTPRETLSVTEDPDFLSLIGSDADFLHIDPTTITQIDNGAENISATVSDDYDGTTRNSSTPDIGADEFTGVDVTAYYYRTKQNGLWAGPAQWEYSSTGSVGTYIQALQVPTGSASLIDVLNTDTIVISLNASAKNLRINTGSSLTQNNGISFSISEGGGADASGTDFIVEGLYVINGTQPTFASNAVAEIRNGAIVRADGNTGGQSDDFARNTSVTFKNGSIFQWNNTLAFETNGLTYFPNSGSSDVPVFRISSSPLAVAGSTGNTIINGKFEVNDLLTYTWANSGSKTFRNGFGGGGTLVHDNTSGTFIISGSTASIDSTLTLNINNTTLTTTDIQIASSSTCTISKSPAINIGTVTYPNALFVIDGNLIHDGSTPVNLNSGSGDLTVNGYISGTGSISCNSSNTDISIGGNTGDNAGSLKLNTSGSLDTLNSFSISRTGSLPSLDLGSNMSVLNTITILSPANFAIKSYTLNLPGTITGTGTLSGSSSSNLIVSGTSGSVGTLYFKNTYDSLNNLTIIRTGSGAKATLGSSLKISGILNITNAATALVMSPITTDTLTLNGTITGSGTLTGSLNANLSIGGSSGGSVGTLRFTTGSDSLNHFGLNRTNVGTNAAAVLGSSLKTKALTLTNGILATGNNLLTWIRTGSLLPATQTTYTANSTSYKNSYICLCTGTGTELTLSSPYDGTVGLTVNNISGSSDIWFPVGVDFISPNRMSINNTNGTAFDLTVAMKKGDIGNTPLPRVNRIWYMSASASGAKATMKLYFTKQNSSQYGITQDEIETGFFYNDIHLVQKNYLERFTNNSNGADILDRSNNTTYPESTEIYGQYTFGISEDTSLIKNGMTAFTRFTVVNAAGVILPSTITNLKAYQLGAAIKLQWTTVSETNTDHYELERSNNALDFTNIYTVKAKGNSNTQTGYGFTDLAPLKGKNYFRIKAVDKNGQASYTNIVLINMAGNYAGVLIYPNPVEPSNTALAFSNMPAARYSITLHGNDGKVIMQQNISHSGGSAAYTMYLPAQISAGVYHITITGADKIIRKKLVVN